MIVRVVIKVMVSVRETIIAITTKTSTLTHNPKPPN